jgi:hypothetical protein
MARQQQIMLHPKASGGQRVTLQQNSSGQYLALSVSPGIVLGTLLGVTLTLSPSYTV